MILTRIVFAQEKADGFEDEKNKFNIFGLKTVRQLVEDVEHQLVADNLEGVHLTDKLKIVVEHFAVDVIEVVGVAVQLDVFADHGLQDVGAHLRPDVRVQDGDEQGVFHHESFGSQYWRNQT